MAGIKRLKDYFFQITSVMRVDGTIGGVRLRKGDKPTQQTMEDLLASSTFSKESSDRSKIYTGSTDLGTEQGLVVLATDAQAKSNTSQLVDRSIVVQPSQLPTVAPDSNTIDTTLSDFTGNVIDVSIDGTVGTRNNFKVKLTNSFITYFQNLINSLNSNIGNFIPLTGTNVSSPVTGPIEMQADGGRFFSSSGYDSEINFFNSTTDPSSSGIQIRAYDIGSGTIIDPEYNAELRALPSVMYLTSTDKSNNSRTRVINSGTNLTLASNNITTGNGTTIDLQNSLILNSITSSLLVSSYDTVLDTNGFGVRTNTVGGNPYGYLKSDNVTTNQTYQMPNKSGTLALLDDVASYNTTSITPNSIDIGNGNKTFTVSSGLAYKFGDRVRASVIGQLTSFLEGHVFSYSGTTLVMSVDSAGGAGFGSPTGSSFNNWQISRGGVSHLTSNINFANTQFTGGTAPSVTDSYFTYTKFGNMVFGQIFISYTGGSGSFTSISVSLPANSGLSPFTLFVGCGFCFTNQTNTIQLQVNTFTTGNGGFTIFPSNSGPDIQSGTFNISGTVIYPISAS